MTGRGSISGDAGAFLTTIRQIVIVGEVVLRTGPNRAGTVKQSLHLCDVIRQGLLTR